MAHKTVVLDGELSLLVSGQADCELLIPESGESGVLTALRQAYPVYDGPMEITPTQETQTLSTTLKSLMGAGPDIAAHDRQYQFIGA